MKLFLPLSVLILVSGCGRDKLSSQPGALQVPVEIDFGNLSVGITGERLFVIESVGRGAVSVTDILLDHAELSLAEPTAAFTLTPGEQVSVLVRWTATAAGPHLGRIRVLSNAEDSPELMITTRGLATPIESCDDGDPCTVGQWDPASGACRTVTDQSLPGCNVGCIPGALGDEPTFAGRWFEEVWSSDRNDVWAVGADGAVVHRDQTGWSVLNTCIAATLFSVWGFSATEVWTVGQNGTVLRWDGVTWQDESIPGFTGTLWSIWGISGDDLWVVGDLGVAYHRTAQAWTQINTGSTTRLYSVWGDSAADVWAVGEGGESLHWDGSLWQLVTTPVVGNLFSVRGQASDRVWAVGQTGTVISWDGSEWLITPSGTSTTLFAVWGSGVDDYWVSGESGTLRHFAAGSWTDHSEASATRIYGLWGLASDLVWAAGSMGGVREWDGASWAPAQ